MANGGDARLSQFQPTLETEALNLAPEMDIAAILNAVCEAYADVENHALSGRERRWIGSSWRSLAP